VTPDFISAAYDGDVARMRHLTDNFSIDVNDADYDKRTALHLAASEGHRDVCEFLLEQGADVNFPARNFYTPLGRIRL
jgi:ankyrin repeat protein